MGKVTVEIKATNFEELSDFERKKARKRPRDFVGQALVDTGATRFYLQASAIRKLRLRAIDHLRSRTMSDRTETRTVYSPVRLEIQGRSGLFEVVELPDTLPNVVGQIPLEHMDWVVDLKNRRLIPNPEHKHGELADEF